MKETPTHSEIIILGTPFWSHVAHAWLLAHKTFDTNLASLRSSKLRLLDPHDYKGYQEVIENLKPVTRRSSIVIWEPDYEAFSPGAMDYFQRRGLNQIVVSRDTKLQDILPKEIHFFHKGDVLSFLASQVAGILSRMPHHPQNS